MKKTSPSKLAVKIEKGDWNDLVKARAGHKCELCPNTDCQMHAHHIEAKGSLVLRISPENGICLCARCHMSIHGQNGITEQQTRVERLKEVRKDDLEYLTQLRHNPPHLNIFDVEERKTDLKKQLSLITSN